MNLKTKSDNYPIPNAHSRLAQLHGAKVFAKANEYKGFWQILVHEDSIEKTAIINVAPLLEMFMYPLVIDFAAFVNTWIETRPLLSDILIVHWLPQDCFPLALAHHGTG